MVTTGKAAASQRQRWEGGRLQLARQKLPVLLPRALKERSALLFDLAVDLTVPPLSIIGLCIGAGLLLEASLFVVDKQLHLGALPWLAAALMIGLYVMRGVHLSGLGLKGLLALAWAPFYVLWKLTLIRPWKKKSDAWIRTTRESELPKE
jgi:hypothetical protein